MHWELVPVFFAIAFVYASVGFGGGSSYLAVLSLTTLPFQEIRIIALLCNIVVVLEGSIVYLKQKQVDFKKVLPLVIVSVPMAFLGARLKINERTFFILLGTSLIAAAVLLWLKVKSENGGVSTKPNMVKDGAIGGVIGFLSGMVGIGGGIFLSPVLNLLKWDNARKIAATASIFILFNSIAGIAGQFSRMTSTLDGMLIYLLCGAVFFGGIAGSNIGSKKFDLLTIRRITAILVFVAGVNVLIKHL